MMSSSSLSRTEALLWLLFALAGAGAAAVAVTGDWQTSLAFGAMGLFSGVAIGQLRRARRALRLLGGALDRAARGDLEARIVLLGDKGEIARLAADTNRLLDVTDAFVREAHATLAHVRDGKFHRRIVERGMAGTFRRASRVMNEAVSTIAARLKGFSAVVGEFEQSVGAVTSTVDRALQGLSRAAADMRTSALETEQRTTTIGKNARETSLNVSTVASAARQLNAAATEISEQATRSLRVVEGAAGQVSRTRAAMGDLGHAVGGITEIVNLIRQIAEQTKMLALNATIESARAGAAGCGFAIVAQEVKTLATQTEAATDSIEDTIKAVEDCMRRCIEAIEGIAGTASQVVEAATAISAATAEQTGATEEIARSILTVSQATEQVCANTDYVESAASNTGQAADDVADASGTLASETQRLEHSVASFLARAREVSGAQPQAA